MTTVKDIIGSNNEEDLVNFDITEIQAILSNLRDDQPVDIAHAEKLCQETLRCADLLSELLAKTLKTTSHLENKLNVARNKALVNFTSDTKVTADLRKAAAESDPEVETLADKLAVAKGVKVALEKKYEILIKSHHHWKDIAGGIRKSIVGFVSGN